jgi:NitT/TauT family transport system ATP-binding protein
MEGDAVIAVQETTPPIIEIAGASKTYRTRDGEVPSLRPVDFVVRDGEFFVVVGPSGCGKTTLLKMIAGLLPPSEGQIHIDGKIVLMDEPFGALDAMTRERMNVELQNIQRETRKTVFLITHSIPEAVFLADRVLVMSERPGTIAAIYDVPLSRPRSLDTMADPTFAELTKLIRQHFNVRHADL